MVTIHKLTFIILSCYQYTKKEQVILLNQIRSFSRWLRKKSQIHDWKNASVWECFKTKGSHL